MPESDPKTHSIPLTHRYMYIYQALWITLENQEWWKLFRKRKLQPFQILNRSPLILQTVAKAF